MKALILAAGYGTRMSPLTDHTPKPLLQIANKPIMQYHIERLRDSGVTNLVINTGHLGEQIEQTFGKGEALGVAIQYSREGTPLETGGAIAFATSLLGNEPFLLVNGDVYTDYPFEKLLKRQPDIAHLVLVPKPEFQAQGDFGLESEFLRNETAAPYTYTGIGVYNPEYFARFDQGESFPLGPLLHKEAEAQKITAELYNGRWFDIGTPERLNQIDKLLSDET